ETRDFRTRGFGARELQEGGDDEREPRAIAHAVRATPAKRTRAPRGTSRTAGLGSPRTRIVPPATKPPGKSTRARVRQRDATVRRARSFPEGESKSARTVRAKAMCTSESREPWACPRRQRKRRISFPGS